MLRGNIYHQPSLLRRTLSLPSSQMPDIRVLTLMLAGLAMLGPFAIDTYLPAFDRISADLGVDSVLMQHTLSVYLLSFALMSLFWGTLSDSFGRRPVIIFSLLVFLVGSIGSAFAPSYGWLLFFRGLQGCSAGAGRIVGQALARDRYQGAEAQRLFANIAMVFGLAPAIAPILGGYLSTHIGWRSIFVTLSGLTLLLILASWRHLPETLPVNSRQPIRLGAIVRNYLHVASNRRFLLAIAAIGLAFSGFGLYIASAARFILDILQLPETAFGWLFVPFIIGSVSGSMLSSRLAGKMDPAKLILIGQGIMAMGAIGNVLYNLFFVAAVPWAVLPIMVYGFGMSAAIPGMTVVSLSIFPSLRGMASSVQSTMQMLVFALVAGFIAPLLFESALLLACGSVGSAVLCAGVWHLSERLGKRE